MDDAGKQKLSRSRRDAARATKHPPSDQGASPEIGIKVDARRLKPAHSGYRDPPAVFTPAQPEHQTSTKWERVTPGRYRHRAGGGAWIERGPGRWWRVLLVSTGEPSAWCVTLSEAKLRAAALLKGKTLDEFCD